jgi:hypothetical protein
VRQPDGDGLGVAGAPDDGHEVAGDGVALGSCVPVGEADGCGASVPPGVTHGDEVGLGGGGERVTK